MTDELPLPGQNRAALMTQLAKNQPELSRDIIHGLPYTYADVAFAARHEMAVTVGDVLMRRTHVAFESRDHGIEVAGGIADLMADILGWNDAECRAQIEMYVAEVKRGLSVNGLPARSRSPADAPVAGVAGLRPRNTDNACAQTMSRVL